MEPEQLCVFNNSREKRVLRMLIFKVGKIYQLESLV